MSFETPQVFISSTSEFAAERKSLAGAIAAMKDMDFHPYIYEDEALPGTSAEQQCARRLRQSELVLLLVGSKFGTCFPNRDTSIVQWEYEYAKKVPVPVHPYLKRVADAAIDDRQKQFIQELTDFRGGTWSRFFDDERQLVEWSVDDLRRWRLDSWQLHQRERGARRQWKDRLVMGIGALVSLGLAGSLIAGVLTDVPMEKLAMVLVAGLAALGIVGWLLKKDDL